MKLYGYYRSSATYRVRIALNIKGIEYENTFINLKDGEQHQEDYLKINPQGLVPSLEVDGCIFTQSMAILNYIEECYPQPSLLPGDLEQRTHIRSLAQIITSDIHPLNNLRVLKYVEHELKITDLQKKTWYQHWIHEGFIAAEKILQKAPKHQYCLSDTPSLADICLAPQIYNAERFNCNLGAYPLLQEKYANIMKLEAFERSYPDNQKDAV
jgi:maleylacetoacetate isomerase